MRRRSAAPRRSTTPPTVSPRPADRRAGPSTARRHRRCRTIGPAGPGRRSAACANADQLRRRTPTSTRPRSAGRASATRWPARHGPPGWPHCHRPRRQGWPGATGRRRSAGRRSADAHRTAASNSGGIIQCHTGFGQRRDRQPVPRRHDLVVTRRLHPGRPRGQQRRAHPLEAARVVRILQQLQHRRAVLERAAVGDLEKPCGPAPSSSPSTSRSCAGVHT